MKDSNPLGLLAEVFKDGVVLLRQDPHRLRGMTPQRCELRQHVFLFGQGFTSRAIVDDVHRRPAGKEQVKGSQIILKSTAGVEKVDLCVCPYPAPLLISLVSTRKRATVAATITRQL